MRRTRRRGVGHESEGGSAVVLIVLIVLVMGVGSWVAAYAGANGKVPRGTTVAGIEIGGRDQTAAAAALARGVRTQGQEPITVAVGTVTTRVAPEDAGLSIDYVATVAKALGPRSWDPRALWRYYGGGGGELPPVVHVDYRKLDGLLDALDELAGQPARDAGISLSGGQIALTQPQNGVQIDDDLARQALVDTYASGSATVRLPLLLSQPDVDQADLDNALATIANPAVSGPVTLAFAGSQVTLAPRQYADLLSLVDQDGGLALDVDSAGLAAIVDPQAQDTQPVDATVAFQEGAPTVVKAVAGQAYDEAGVTAAFLQGVTADGAARTVPVKGSSTRATFTTKDAKQLGVSEPVASFTVSVPSTVGPSFTDAVNRLSGALVRPGDTFSFNGRVGVVNGSGARLATAAWNAGFLAGMSDVLRTPAPTYADGLPEGRDAMVDAATDLQMRNDSSYGVLLSARMVPGGPGAAGSVVVDAWSTKEFEVSASTGGRYAPTPRTTVPSADPACVASAGSDGFTVDLVRSVTRIGDPTPVRSDTVTTTYQPEQAVVCQPAAP